MHQLMLRDYGMNKLFTVYIHISPSWKYYVGLTSAKNVKNRWGKNGNGYKTQYFRRAIDKYGWENFIHIVVRNNLTQKDASNLEKLLIKQLKSNDSKYGYNISNGGEATFLGLHHTEQAKRKIAERFLDPVNQYDLNGKLIKSWNSIREAGRILDIDSSSIAKCCKGFYKTSKNYVWRYIGDTFDKYNLKKYQQPKRRVKVKQFTTSGELLRIWESVSAASLSINTSTSSIISCCKGKKGRKTVKGYVWRYLDDDFDKYNAYNEKYSPVCQFDLNDNFIAEFKTIHEASGCTNVSSSNIISCCNNYTKKAGGYIWRYKGDYI